MLDATEDVFRLAQEGAAGVGQRHMMTAAIEQCDANFPLEVADLLAERRLRGVESAGGTREVQLFGHRHEVPQMPQFHPNRLDGAAKNRNPGIPTVSRETSYEMFKVLSGNCPPCAANAASAAAIIARGSRRLKRVDIGLEIDLATHPREAGVQH